MKGVTLWTQLTLTTLQKKTIGEIAIELVRLIECTSQTRIRFKTTEEIGKRLIEGFYAKYLNITELTQANIIGIKTYVAEAKWKEDLPIIYNKPELGWFTFKEVDAKSYWAIINTITTKSAKNEVPIFIKINESIVHDIRRFLPEYSIKLVVDSAKENENLYKVAYNLDEDVLSFNFEHLKRDNLVKAIIEKFVNGTMLGRNISVRTSEADYIKEYFEDTGFEIKAYSIGESEVSAVDIHPKEKHEWIDCRMIVATDNITIDLYDYFTKIKVLDGIDSPLIFDKDCPGKMASAYGAARNVRYEEPVPAKEATRIAGDMKMKIADLNDIIKRAAENSELEVAIDLKSYPPAVIKKFRDARYEFSIKNGNTYIQW